MNLARYLRVRRDHLPPLLEPKDSLSKHLGEPAPLAQARRLNGRLNRGNTTRKL